MWKVNKGRGGKKNVMLWCRWDFCFLGGETCVTKQIKDAWAPFSMRVHCVAHWINLAVQFLSNLTLFTWLEVFMEICIHIFTFSKVAFGISEIYYCHGNQGQQHTQKMSRHFECPCLIHRGRSWLSTSRCL